MQYGLLGDMMRHLPAEILREQEEALRAGRNKKLTKAEQDGATRG
jgi:hypothetical protein